MFILVDADNTEKLHIIYFTNASQLRSKYSALMVAKVQIFTENAVVGQYELFADGYYLVVRVQ